MALAVRLAGAPKRRLRCPSLASNRINPARQLCLHYHSCTCCSSCWRSSLHLTLLPISTSNNMIDPVFVHHGVAVALGIMLRLRLLPPRGITAHSTMATITRTRDEPKNNPMQCAKACCIVAIVVMTATHTRSAPRHAA